MNVFTYGSLMFDAVWQRVIGVDYHKIPARIEGFRRLAIRGETYPALIPGKQDAIVDGVVYLNVSAPDIERLDRFEGDYYRRITVPCRLADGGTADAAVYRFKTRFRHLVTQNPWDLDAFKATGLGQFLDNYKGFADSTP